MELRQCQGTHAPNESQFVIAGGEPIQMRNNLWPAKIFPALGE